MMQGVCLPEQTTPKKLVHVGYQELNQALNNGASECLALHNSDLLQSRQIVVGPCMDPGELHEKATLRIAVVREASKHVPAKTLAELESGQSFL
jgi:hypothetical protein